MYERGDQVLVQGYDGKTAVLRIWESLGRGLLLCTEEGYHRKMSGQEAPAVGFPLWDVVSLVRGEGPRP